MSLVQYLFKTVLWKSSLEGNSLMKIFFPHYIIIYTQLFRIILHTVLIIKYLAFISLNSPVKHPSCCVTWE